MSNKIAESFSQKTHKYREFAISQKEAIKDLLELLPKDIINKKGLWLDIGSGAYGFDSLFYNKQSIKSYIPYDISEETLKKSKTKDISTPICGDMDFLSFKENSFNGITSASAFQWSREQKLLWQKSLKLLKKDGIGIFATLVSGTLEPLQLLQKEFNLNQPTNYLYFKEIENYVEELDLEIIHSSIKEYREKYQTAKEALKAISNIGASPKQNRVLNRDEIIEFLKKYKELTNNYNEYSYHFLIVRKR